MTTARTKTPAGTAPSPATTTAGQPTGTATLLRAAGHLPQLEHEPVPTPWYDAATPDIRLTVLDNAIAVVYGPSGVGKTATVVSVLRSEPGRFAYANLAHKSGMKDAIESLHTALHGYNGTLGRKRTTRAMRNEIENTLSQGGVGIVADEVHYVGEGCMLTLAQIWERVRAINGDGFPLFLIGATAPNVIRSNPELLTRIRYPIHIDTLAPDDAIAAAKTISPRCAATSDRKLLLFDQRLGHGTLRVWHHFIAQVERIPDLHGTPIGRDEFNVYLNKNSDIRTVDNRA